MKEGPTQVLVKIVLNIRGHGNPYDDAMTSFFSDSNSSILGLCNNLSFVSELNLKDSENRQK